MEIEERLPGEGINFPARSLIVKAGDIGTKQTKQNFMMR